jgi:hypothetical protein
MLHFWDNFSVVVLNSHDWLPYAGVPVLGYASLIVTLLLIAGVYGAWDMTLWIVKNLDKT